MPSVLLAVSLDLHPFDLYRVERPDFPGAEACSARACVTTTPPPPGTPWTPEEVPHPDGWPAVEAIAALGAGPWHAAGITGAGVRIAVFDVAWFTSELDPSVLGPVITHDCFAHPSCEVPMDTNNARFSFENGTHGFACAEVIHDLVPDAELHLVRANGTVALENAVDWAIRADIDIVSMSMSFFNTSFYDNTGRVTDAVARLATHGVQLVTSAGNTGDRHWWGQYRDVDHDGRMDFDGDNALDLYLPAAAKRGVYLNWNEHGVCGTSDLDAWLVSGDGRVVGRSEGRQRADADSCSPIERLTGTVDETGWYKLVVFGRRVATASLDVDVVSTAGTILQNRPERSIADPGVSPYALTVGAVRASDYLAGDIEDFSSRGPSWAGQPKPDVAGPNGLSTSTYGPGGFFGTSAATPAVAGALGLILARDPELGPLGAADRLRAAAIDDTPVFGQPDARWGHGKARLPDLDLSNVPCGRRPEMAWSITPVLLYILRRRR